MQALYAWDRPYAWAEIRAFPLCNGERKPAVFDITGRDMTACARPSLLGGSNPADRVRLDPPSADRTQLTAYDLTLLRQTELS
jgi:hypothetical protein